MASVAGEVKPLRINTRYDLTGAISFSLEIIDPSGGTNTITTSITVGTVDITSSGGTIYYAHQYVIYDPGAVIFPLSGLHNLKLTVNFGATKTLKTFYKVIDIAA